MKRKLMIFGLAIPLMFLGFSLPEFYPSVSGNVLSEEDMIEAPQEVMDILQNSCVGCHSTDSQAEKAKKKLDFKQWGKLSKAKKIAKLGAICDEIVEGKMPTEKFLSHYPDKALTEEDIDLICEWTDSEIETLIGSTEDPEEEE